MTTIIKGQDEKEKAKGESDKDALKRASILVP